MAKKENILIYRLGSLGDTVIALPCFHKIREVYPNADITLLTNRPVMAKAAPLEAILGKDYFYDHIIDYPVGTRYPQILLKLIKQIRSLKISTVINITATRSRKSDIRDLWFFKMAGIRNCVGFNNSEIDYKVSIDPNTGHYEWEAKRLARKIKALGEINLEDSKYWDLRLNPQELQMAKEVMGGLNSDQKIIALNTGTKMQSKDWGQANWLKLVENLGKVLEGWKLIIIGVDEESAFAEQCLEVWNGRGINICGKTSPRVSAAVLKETKIFIGHDSGPMHLAACVGVPCVAIFAARNLPKQWFPRGENNKVIYHKTDCAGCGLEVCIVEKKKCILSITVDEVQHAVLEVLQKTPVL